eukprot:9784346-Alexandrium_andersonii.AAC.1
MSFEVAPSRLRSFLEAGPYLPATSAKQLPAARCDSEERKLSLGRRLFWQSGLSVEPVTNQDLRTPKR